MEHTYWAVTTGWELSGSQLWFTIWYPLWSSQNRKSLRYFYNTKYSKSLNNLKFCGKRPGNSKDIWCAKIYILITFVQQQFVFVCLGLPPLAKGACFVHIHTVFYFILYCWKSYPSTFPNKMAPRVRIWPQTAGSDYEVIDIDYGLGSDLNSDSDHAPITHPDSSQSHNSNQSCSATGGAVGHRTDLEQVWKLIMLNLVSLCSLNLLGIAQGSAWDHWAQRWSTCTETQVHWTGTKLQKSQALSTQWEVEGTWKG